MPSKYIRATPEARFWSKVDKQGALPERRPDLGPCWIWTASLLKEGEYGRFNYAPAGHYAHRASFLFNVGPIPDGYDIDHLCRNHRCVNPRHLEAVPHRTNALRGDGYFAQAARGEGKWSRQDYCARGHALAGDNVYVYDVPGKRSFRQCLTCRRNADKARRAS